MKTLLVAINSKYIHSNLANLYIKKYADKYYGYDFCTLDFTINQYESDILAQIYKQKAQIVAFSCYIWNIEMVKNIATSLKKVDHKVKIVFGGPEVSYNYGDIIKENIADYIVVGEGEKTFCELVKSLENGEGGDVDGVCRLVDGDVEYTPNTELLSLDDIPFVYSDLSEFENRIIYYESSRGCPFGCSYCMSSVTKKVRFLSLDRTFSDLDFFLKNKVKQVKFVDRTFNCDKKRTYDIIEYLIKNDNKITNFHFEISADLIEDKLIDLIKTARAGLFQFEIGVQSTNLQTLKAINRSADTQKIFSNVKKLKNLGNVHLHLDLIAGLPHEDYDSFKNSFNEVIANVPDQLQLGFLKVLYGAPMHSQAKEHQIEYTHTPPYEVLSTHKLTFDDVLRLKTVEQMVEIYYNTHRFDSEIAYLRGFFKTPFDMFEGLADFYEKGEYYLAPHSKLAYYDILYKFAVQKVQGIDLECFKELAKYDICTHEKYRKLPEWVNCDLTKSNRDRIIEFYQKNAHTELFAGYDNAPSTLLAKVAHIEGFSVNPFTMQNEQTFVLFNYNIRDINDKCIGRIIEM